MKILYLLNFAGKGGTEKYVYNLMEELHGKKADCFLVYNICGQLCEKAESLGVPAIRLDMKSPFDIAAAKKLASICRKNDIDIIHTQFPRENYIALLSKLFNRKVKVFNTSHLIIHTGFLWKITNRIFTRFNENIISVCTYGKEVLISNGTCKNRIDVIFNGIQLKNPNMPSDIRQEFNIDENTFVISTLTRYTSEKGVPFLVDIASKLKEMTDKKFKLLIAGDGEMFEEVKQKILKLGLSDVILQLGYRTDSDNILAGSDLFINTSSSEALSFAILEAIGHGLPVVATDVGGTGDIVNDENDCGILIEYGDAHAGAGALKSLIEDKDLRIRYSEGAKKTAAEKFDIDKLHSVLLDKYNKCIK